MNGAAQGGKLLALLSYARAGSISVPRVRSLFPDDFEWATELLGTCGGRLLKGELGEYFEVPIHSRVRLGIELCRLGVDLALISRHLTWRDFESFVCQVANESGYIAFPDVRLKRPVAQIDAVCVYDDFAIALDCKHWKRAAPSSLRVAAQAQALRAERLFSVSTFEHVRIIMPAVVTIQETTSLQPDEALVVPVYLLPSFFLNARYLPAKRYYSHS